MEKQWKVKALIPFPMNQIAESDPITGGLPKNLEWESKVIEVKKECGNEQIKLKKIEKGEFWEPLFYGKITEPVEIQITTFASEPHCALQKVNQLLEDICDDLAFRLQMPIPITQLEVLDVTEPVNIGEERDFLLYPFPNGYQHFKFRTVSYLGSTFSEKFIDLKEDYSYLDTKDRAIMGWYHKALSSSSIADKFLFLVISTEILCKKSGVKVMKPYINSCSHEITHCPKCNKPTEKMVFGQTFKKYLIDNLGMDEDKAKDIWKLRQIVHGEKEFNDQLISKLSDVYRALLSCVTRAIKHHLNIKMYEPPLVRDAGIGISSNFLGGKRIIQENDLN